MAKKYPWRTAGELREYIKSHPESGPAIAERELEELGRYLDENLKPLVSDLKALGFDIESIDGLREPYPEALPVLLQHLRMYDIYDSRNREAIASALITRDMKENLPELIELFRDDPDNTINGPKWRLGNAIEELYDDRYAEDVAELALDTSHAGARTCLVDALAKSKKPVARKALESLKSDPDMSKWVLKIEKQQKKRSEKSRKRRQASLANLNRSLKETSTSLDFENVPQLLKAISGVIPSGFGSAQIRKVTAEMRDMEMDEESLLEFTVKPGWRRVPLQILLHKCDEDTVNIYFLSKANVVGRIDEELERFLESLEQ